MPRPPLPLRRTRAVVALAIPARRPRPSRHRLHIPSRQALRSPVPQPDAHVTGCPDGSTLLLARPSPWRSSELIKGRSEPLLDFTDDITEEPLSLRCWHGRAWILNFLGGGISGLRRQHHRRDRVPASSARTCLIIFDNIMNREIPWPCVPAELIFEAYDLIDKGECGSMEKFGAPLSVKYYYSNFSFKWQVFHGEIDGNDEWRHKDSRWVATAQLMELLVLHSIHALCNDDGDSAAGYIDTLKKNITQGEWSEQVSRVGQHAARTRLHVQTRMYALVAFSVDNKEYLQVLKGAQVMINVEIISQTLKCYSWMSC
ncbi:unnamed protein product [Miscanthus lutarioriparius]|uniref:Uncharacterized protein n=1 Tax=Miscanthus lutarioriparius TaxID=422564 RepID=A0A811RNM7_9POAL|nr:unnamed protein product [Miscanthus lutarioriparius]